MPVKPLSTRQHKTRAAFINAFISLVVEHGFDQITVTDIANTANYGRWTFYQYFKSKEEVAWACFVIWMTNLNAHIVAAVGDLPFPQREYQSWRIIFAQFQQYQPFLMHLDSMLVSHWREKGKEFIAQQFQQHLVDGHFTLKEGVRPEVATRLYVGALTDLLQYWSGHPELGDADAVAAEFFTFIFGYPPPDTGCS